MYVMSLQRYEPRTVRALARIEAARAVVEEARILPAQEEILRKSARVGSVHYSNAMEGNELPKIEASRAVEQELDTTTTEKLELVNYVKALEFIEDAAAEGTIVYTPECLKTVHGVMSRGLGREDRPFKPHHEGNWRDGIARVEDAVAVYHEAPGSNYDEVSALMEERLVWLEDRRTSDDYLPAVLAAVAHFEIVEVHPFADYNGRTARLFTHAVLLREGVIKRRVFSPERFYAEDKDAYYTALRAIKRQRHLNEWVAYFTDGLASEMERAADLVRRLNAQTASLPLPVQLTRHQEVIVAELTAGGRAFITRADAEGLTGLKKVQTANELSALVDAGVLRPRGAGPTRIYALAGGSASRLGRSPTWTPEKIEEELSKLMAELGHWPSFADFRSAGQTPLYQAVSRNGGVASWKARLSSPASPQARNDD